MKNTEVATQPRTLRSQRTQLAAEAAANVYCPSPHHTPCGLVCHFCHQWELSSLVIMFVVRLRTACFNVTD